MISPVSTGAAINVPSAAPLICSADGSPRRPSGNHLYRACIDIGVAGPSAAPNSTRPATSAGTEATSSTGTCATAHSKAITNSMTRLEIREEKNPARNPDRLNSTANELAISP